MSASLTAEECQIIQRLVDEGVARRSATLAVVMVTREHSRPESELIDIVRQYQSLESSSEAQGAIHDLKDQGWLEEYMTYGKTLLRQSGSLRKQIADKLGDDSVKGTLKQIRNVIDSSISILGTMNDDEVYLTYLDILKTAQSEICLPMLATTPDLASVPTLQERARSGVKVRILLADPAIVALLRGETMRPYAEHVIAGWIANGANIPNIEVRITQSLADAYQSSCMLVDRRLLRFDVYDPHRQRSLQGEMVQFRSPDGFDQNIIRMFASWFDSAWEKAKPIGTWSKLVWYSRRFWNIWVGIGFCVLAIVITKTVPQGVFISLAAGFLLNGIVQFKDSIKVAMVGWLRK